MSRIRIFLLVLAVFAGQAGAQKAATVNDVSLHPPVADAGPRLIGTSAERQLFDLVNQARTQAGLLSLRPDEGLAEAARTHAVTMAAEGQLSHQFPGEPSLSQRLAAQSKLHMDRAGENVAYASSVEQAEDNLMHSPLHRQNLLDPGFNVAGFAVVQNGPRFYVVQDFGHSLQSISAPQAENTIAQHLEQMRAEENLPPLHGAVTEEAKSTACAMARADSLKTPSPAGRYIVRYTAMQPETLPANIAKVISDRSVKSFANGTCYARTATYPNGAYWVVLVFY